MADRTAFADAPAPTSEREEVTRFLDRWAAGDKSAERDLFRAVYTDLHDLARYALRRAPKDFTLQTTDIVNDAYLRLIEQKSTPRNRGHFHRIAAMCMRRVVIDHARRRSRLKRRDARSSVESRFDEVIGDDRPIDLLELEEALAELETAHPLGVRVVELRFFSGLTEEQAADALRVSRSTISREWRVAKAWLTSRLG